MDFSSDDSFEGLEESSMFSSKEWVGCSNRSLAARRLSHRSLALHALYRNTSREINDSGDFNKEEASSSSSAWADETPQFPTSSTRRSHRASKMSQKPPSSTTEQMGARDPSASNDPFAAFRAFQTSTLLKAVGIGRDGMSYNFTEEEGEGGSPTRLKPLFSRGWASRPKFTVKSLYQAIVSRCESGRISEAPLYMIMKLAESREDARTVVDAVAAVRGCLVTQGRFSLFDPKLCSLFTHMCHSCDAPDVLAEALNRANELGLLLSFNRVHDVLRAWGENLDLHKMETVVKAMDKGGITPNAKTAYILIRAAVNSGRQDVVERFTTEFTTANIRLTPTTMRLVELSRERALGQREVNKL